MSRVSPKRTTVSCEKERAMTTNPQRLQFRRTVPAAVAMIALISALVTAGSNSTTLSNGAT